MLSRTTRVYFSPGINRSHYFTWFSSYSSKFLPGSPPAISPSRGVTGSGISHQVTGSAQRQLPRERLYATMPESRSRECLVWIDCEMTGLNTSQDTIMSLACFVTDADLNTLDEDGYEAVIHHSQHRMDAMGEWCKEHHGQSGLTAQCLDSQRSISAEIAAEQLLGYIKKFVPERRKALLAGNTVHADKSFLVLEPWTKVIKHLHHRILDVSSLKEAARRWSTDEVIKNSPRKAGKHEARADILESIAEAKYYKEVLFQGKTLTDG